MTTPPKSVLFVCLGNICRSPSANAVMQKQSTNARLNIAFDSAGTAHYHIGEPPDRRAIKTGHRLGFDLSPLRARQITMADFYHFDIIFAMDNSNLANLQMLQTKAKTHASTQPIATLQLFDPTGKAVADPYYGDDGDFLAMFEHIQTISHHWIEQWTNHTH